MKAPTVIWTRRAHRRLMESVSYIAENFSPVYADAFLADVMQTVDKITENPNRGSEAFPELKLHSFRYRLCASRRWAVYYCSNGSVVEIRSIRHALQNTRSPSDL